jgi:hypothetical protein
MQMEAQPDAPQWELQAERSLAELLRPEPVPLGAVSPVAQAARPPAPIPSEAQPRAPEQLEPPVAQPPRLPEASPLASPRLAQPLQAPEHA